MNDKVPEISNYRELFEIAVHFLGENWLDKQVDEYMLAEDFGSPNRFSTPSVVQQYARGLVECGYKEPSELTVTEEFTPGTAEFVRLGEYIMRLSEVETYYDESDETKLGIPESIRHRLREVDYQSARFELATASNYVFHGYTPQLIEEGSSPAPDIRFPNYGPLFIECKRTDASPGSSQKRQNKYPPLVDKVVSFFDKESIVIFDLDRPLKTEDVRTIEKNLPNTIIGTKPQQVSAPFGTIYIIPYQNPNKDIIVPVETKSATNQLFSHFLNEEIIPAISPHLDYGPTLDDFEFLDFKGDIQRIGQQYHCSDVITVGVVYEEKVDYLKQILNQFDAARNKFDKKHPNILHIEVPSLNQLDQDQGDELVGRLGGKLNINSRVSAVVLSTELFEQKSSVEASQFHWSGYLKNHSPAVPIPDDFEIVGASLTEISE